MDRFSFSVFACVCVRDCFCMRYYLKSLVLLEFPVVSPAISYQSFPDCMFDYRTIH